MKNQLFILLLTISLFVSCSKSSLQVYQLKNITVKFQENNSISVNKEFIYDPSNDTILAASNIKLKDITNVIEMFYQSENKDGEVKFKNAKSIKLNLLVVKNDSSIPSKEAFDELIEFLKQKKLVDY